MLKDTLTDLIEQTARDLGYMIYQSSVLLRGENTRIAVRIDSLKGVSHDDCEAYSRELGLRIDSSGLLPGYFLEVSSPGIDRKVRNPEEFSRFIGQSVKVKVRTAEGDRVFKGTIREVRDDSVVLDGEKGEMIFEFSVILDANLDYK